MSTEKFKLYSRSLLNIEFVNVYKIGNTDSV